MAPKKKLTGVITEPLPIVIEPDYFTPRLLLLLSNALVWRESALLRQSFGLGTNDWRVIATLATNPGSTATEITEFLDANKAVVSKAVNALLDRKLIASSDGPRGSRHLFLTAAGAEMHDKMLPISMEGEEVLISALTPREVKQLHAILDKMMAKRLELSPMTRELK